MTSARTREGVVVAGSLHVDLIASAHRLPVRGESLIGQTFAIEPGGKAGNQAASVAAQDVRCAMVGRVGDDEFGGMLLDSLRRHGVDAALVVVDSSAATGASTVLTGEGGDYASIVVPAASALIDAGQIAGARDSLERAAVAVTQLELGGMIAEAFLAAARDAGCRTVLNAAPIPDDLSAVPASLWNVVDVVVANRVEAAMLLGLDAAAAASATPDAAALARRLGVRGVVVTLGGDGLEACLDGVASRVSAWPVEVVDTVGAGDAFVGVLAASLASGIAWHGALVRANAAGALAVARRGGALPPGKAEIDTFLAERG